MNGTPLVQLFCITDSDFFKSYFQTDEKYTLMQGTPSLINKTEFHTQTQVTFCSWGLELR